jgi:peptide/nickel transport system substrate-binding protein
MVDRVGQQLGNYRLVTPLGQGGFAEVYLGQHVRLELQAAIKVLHTHLTGQEAEHFQQEAQTIARLAHPGIVRILDYDLQEGVPFLVMEYAPGGSLRQRYPKGTVVPLTQVVSFMKQVADALQYAHEQKVIHRDVKPENMLVGRRDEVLLSDFGIATIAHSSGSLSTKEAVGTLAYMAPEQIEGHSRAASDQYALGCVVYEWLCGSRPFEGSPTEVMVQQLSMPPTPLHEKVATVPLEVEQVVLRALAKDLKERFASVQDFAEALEQASQHAYSPTSQMPAEQPAPGSAAAFATFAVPTSQPALPHETPSEPAYSTETPQMPSDAAREMIPLAIKPVEALVPLPLEPALPIRRKALARLPAALLIGLAALVVVGGILGSVSLLAHGGVGGQANRPIATPVRGGTWTEDVFVDVDSLIPNGGNFWYPLQALYLPLFYGDAQGAVHPGAASEIPTVQNGGISADAKTWTFHLRPHLLWSDGQSYDARDVDFTWQLWLNPKFGAAFPNGATGYELIRSADVSADYLTITFHLKQAYAPFLSYWVDDPVAPLPAHHFSSMRPEAILKSPENLNPKVTSGPFIISESQPGNHYTLVRNPRYYRASEGLPYLDKVVYRVVADRNALLKDLQAGTVSAAAYLDLAHAQDYQRLTHYTLVSLPTSATFEGLFFNFHNSVLASHSEVRQAMAMAVDQRALIDEAFHGFATPLCTEHPSALHPGYQPSLNCPVFDLAAADKLLSDNGWVKGPDGVRTKGKERLEFEYSTTILFTEYRINVQAILQRDFRAIGIKLDIQNYSHATFFDSFVPEGKASPPTGAVAGRYDIAEWANIFSHDPDDSWMLACDQFLPTGLNSDFYCNPALDTLYKQEQAAADPGVRQQLFDQIHKIYLKELPFIVLLSLQNIALVHRGIHNYQFTPFFVETNIWEWWCDQGKC